MRYLSSKRRRSQAAATKLLHDHYWRAGRYRFEEILGHEFRHSDATVRRWIARQISGVHSDPIDDEHEIRQGHALKMLTRRLFRNDRNVRFHNLAMIINKVAILGGYVVLVLLD